MNLYFTSKQWRLSIMFVAHFEIGGLKRFISEATASISNKIDV